MALRRYLPSPCFSRRRLTPSKLETSKYQGLLYILPVLLQRRVFRRDSISACRISARPVKTNFLLAEVDRTAKIFPRKRNAVPQAYARLYYPRSSRRVRVAVITSVFQAYNEQILLKDNSPSEIAWIGSLAYALILLPGLVSGRLFDMPCCMRLPVLVAFVCYYLHCNSRMLEVLALFLDTRITQRGVPLVPTAERPCFRRCRRGSEYWGNHITHRGSTFTD